MKDELISFEAAKLAKETGFDVTVDNNFDEDGDSFLCDIKNSELRSFEFSAPTQSLLQKYLRENTA